jgi:hypothetical protein
LKNDPGRTAHGAALVLSMLGLLGGNFAAAQTKPPAEQTQPPAPQLKPVSKPTHKVSDGNAKLEIGLWGGFGLSRSLGTTSYLDSWTTFLGTSVVEKTGIDVRTRDIPVAGASVTYFFHSHTGIQILAGYAQSRASGSPRLDFSWTLPDGSLDERSSGPAGAKGWMTSLPLSLNFVERLAFGRWRLDVSAGPTYYFHKFNQDSAFGYSVVRTSPVGGRLDLPPVETYDALAVPLKIPKTSWNSWGANIGAGVRFQASRFLAFAAEARYFYSPDKSLAWTPQTGFYDGMFTSDFPSVPFGDEDLSYLAENGKAFTMTVKPSFFQVSLGVLLTFGR